MNTCEFCQRSYDPTRKGSGPRFCSHTCIGRMMKGRRVGTRLRKALRPCAVCGKPFMTASNFGNARCPTCKTHTCENCGKDFPSRMVSQRYCSQRCSGQANMRRRGSPKGPAHWGWKGDKAGSSVLSTYRGPRWYAIRDTVMERDSYTCQNCGAQPGETTIERLQGQTGKTVRYRRRMLAVHHADRFERDSPERYHEFNDLSKLVTLCLPCHRKAHPGSRESS